MGALGLYVLYFCIGQDNLIRAARDHGNGANRMNHPSNLDTTGNRILVPEVGSLARLPLRRSTPVYMALNENVLLSVGV